MISPLKHLATAGRPLKYAAAAALGAALATGGAGVTLAPAGHPSPALTAPAASPEASDGTPTSTVTIGPSVSNTTSTTFDDDDDPTATTGPGSTTSTTFDDDDDDDRDDDNSGHGGGDDDDDDDDDDRRGSNSGRG